MRQTIEFLVVVLCGLSLAGCGSDEREAREDRETVFDPLVETLDQAEAVEDVVLEQKSRIDQALTEADGEDEDP